MCGAVRGANVTVRYGHFIDFFFYEWNCHYTEWQKILENDMLKFTT